MLERTDMLLGTGLVGGIMGLVPFGTPFGFMAFLAATTLAIDVGMYMVARSQAQNSADAGALGVLLSQAVEAAPAAAPSATPGA